MRNPIARSAVHRPARIHELPNLFKHQGRCIEFIISFLLKMVQELSISDKTHSSTRTVTISHKAGERREARRFEVDWQTVVEGTDCNGGSFQERTKLMSLSSMGAYFEMKTHLEKGAKVKVSIKVPLSEGNWMMYSAKVVRTKRLGKRIGIAIRFKEMRPTFCVR